jgi:hypothetical protein
MVFPDEYSEVDKLFGEPVSPNSRLTRDERSRLNISRLMLNENFLQLQDVIDGTLSENPLFIVEKDIVQEAVSRVYCVLHNYLASLYSFHELLATLINTKTNNSLEFSSSHIIPGNDQGNSSRYSKKVEFLRGLRIDFQHGGFSSLKLTHQGELGEFAGYHIEFDEHEFISNDYIDTPTKYLKHTSENNRRHPICFIANFHKNDMDRFFESCTTWFSSV